MPKGNSSVASAPKAVVALGNPDRADDGVGVAVLAELTPPKPSGDVRRHENRF